MNALNGSVPAAGALAGARGALAEFVVLSPPRLAAARAAGVVAEGGPPGVRSSDGAGALLSESFARIPRTISPTDTVNSNSVDATASGRRQIGLRPASRRCAEVGFVIEIPGLALPAATPAAVPRRRPAGRPR
jgi:hypothetical protein